MHYQIFHKASDFMGFDQVTTQNLSKNSILFIIESISKILNYNVGVKSINIISSWNFVILK